MEWLGGGADAFRLTGWELKQHQFDKFYRMYMVKLLLLILNQLLDNLNDISDAIKSNVRL